jgi:glycosyl hydrolase family 108
MSNAFEDALGFTLAWEGGYVNRPDDPGGETYCGISRKANPAWPGWAILDGLANKHVATPELDALVGDLYRRKYWDVCGCDALPVAEALALFDFAVHSGVTRALKAWSQAPMRTAKGLCFERRKFLEPWLIAHPQFAKGVLNRINALERWVSLRPAKEIAMEPPKSPLMSKTLWFNAAVAAFAAIVGALGQFPEFAPYLAVLTPLGNFLLRFLTKQPVV